MTLRKSCFALPIALLVVLPLMSCEGTDAEKPASPASDSAVTAAGGAGGTTASGDYIDYGYVTVDGKAVKNAKVVVQNKLCHFYDDRHYCYMNNTPQWATPRTDYTDASGRYETPQGTQLGCYVYSTKRTATYGNLPPEEESVTYGFDTVHQNKRVDIHIDSDSCTPSCRSAQCGYAPDGCGGTIFCGGCQPGYACVRNVCENIEK